MRHNIFVVLARSVAILVAVFVILIGILHVVGGVRVQGILTVVVVVAVAAVFFVCLIDIFLRDCVSNH